MLVPCWRPCCEFGRRVGHFLVAKKHHDAFARVRLHRALIRV